MNDDIVKTLKHIDKIEKKKNIINAEEARKLMISDEDTIKEIKIIEKQIKAKITEGYIILDEIKMSVREYMLEKGYRVECFLEGGKIVGPVTIMWFSI